MTVLWSMLILAYFAGFSIVMLHDLDNLVEEHSREDAIDELWGTE